MQSFAKNIICASIFTGIYDVNRNERLLQDDFSIVEKWYNSIHGLGLDGVIFHNGFSDPTILKYQTDSIRFIKVDYSGKFNGNVYRYMVYNEFLKKYESQIEHVFFTDIGDVEVVKNPFEDAYFKQNPHAIFCGDEPNVLDCTWMHNHCEHLRNQIPDFLDFEIKNKAETLLNCGIIGGKALVLTLLMEALAKMHKVVAFQNQTPYTLDMGVFNYTIRTLFPQNILHGFPVNTVFKNYESNRLDCWFRHK